MKKLFLTAILIAVLIFAVSCGGKHYTIYMKNGEEHVAVSKPEYNKKTDTIMFENVDGQKIVVLKPDIDKVVEHKK